MDNTKLPASPTKLLNSLGGGNGYCTGFTKLERAALMIAQGMVASGTYVDGMHSEHPYMAQTAVSFAKAVLEEANK